VIACQRCAGNVRLRQNGVVVVIALIATVAMAMSAMALMRTVDATTSITGNVGAWQSAITAADVAVEDAVAALFERRLIADLTVDDPQHAYFASRGVTQDGRGVPLALQQVANYPSGAPLLTAGNGIEVRYMLERTCLRAGLVTSDNCTIVPISDTPIIVDGESVEAPRVPLFRQTIRVDGPGAATAFVQVWLADLSGRRRLSWRALAE